MRYGILILCLVLPLMGCRTCPASAQEYAEALIKEVRMEGKIYVRCATCGATWDEIAADCYVREMPGLLQLVPALAYPEGWIVNMKTGLVECQDCRLKRTREAWDGCDRARRLE